MRSASQFWLASFGAAVLSLGGLAFAEDDAAGVLSKIHDRNLNFMKIGELAKAKGATRDVRAFGDRLVKDHAFADRRLSELARQEKISILSPGPWTLDELQNQVMSVQKLETSSGAEFDRNFLAIVREDHPANEQFFRSARETLPAQKLRTFVKRQMPVLKQHHQLAMNLNRRVNPDE